MRAFLVVATLAAGMGLWGVSPATAQQTTGSRTTTGTGTSIGNNTAFSQTGVVMDAASFGGAGMGNSLRAATLGGMMGMNTANMSMMSMNAMGMGGMGMNRMGMGMGGMGGMNGMGMGGQGNAPALKIPIRLGESMTRATPFASATPVRAARFEKRLTKLRSLNTGTGVEVEVRAGIATLTGTVPTDRDRELIEQMALLEPGIEKVENQLEVDPASDTREEEIPAGRSR